MPYKDLRSFLEKLDEEKQLIHYSDPVKLSEIGIISKVVSDMGPEGPAMILDNVEGYRGKRLAVGVHGSWANHALSLGLPKDATIQDQF